MTDPLDEDALDPLEVKRLLFASRSSNLLVLKQKYYQQILDQQFDELPDILMEELLKIQAVVPFEENELQTIIQENKDVIASRRNLHYVILPTAYCQLGCDYCGQEHTQNKLNNPLIEQVLLRIDKLLATGKFDSLDIAWFGAEPLVGINEIRKLSPKLHQLADKYSCKYYSRIVTNGLALKEALYKELVFKHKINSIEITLDGTAEFHDSRRHTKSKAKTFDIIFKNILKIVNRPNFNSECSMNIRCNADERNVDGVVPLIELLAFHKLQGKINFYIAPVYSWGNEAHLLTPKNDFASHEIDWLIAMKENGFPIFPLPGRNNVVCTSVMPNDEVVDSYGNVYNCTEVPLVPIYNDIKKYQTGHVFDEFDPMLPNEKPFLDWNDRIADKDEKLWCWNCKILPNCGGRCPKNWIENIPPCPVMKFNMEDRMALMYYLCKESVTELDDQTLEQTELTT